ncbi:MAG: phenylalanine--tRNA ligase subunit alpha [Magnetococcales bacterium]|nr:phenylalanine--tRNA ligase subunit alpha [Magnetococcales bacterium]MBF0419384.1 phenylalanine--tRNA ligase subunit alpha [Magnetococcales bacterium]MBF0435267.1 phenylalanine--tRNA ligase subunit alpha [Magnetococcales bacterium]
MRKQLENLQSQALEEVERASSAHELEEIRVKILGKKGMLTHLLRGLKDVADAERPELGTIANVLKETFHAALAARMQVLQHQEMQDRLASERIDVSLPGRVPHGGGLHPVRQALTEMIEIFLQMGFPAMSGPEVESDWHNFGALNIPPDHPAREMHDTFYLHPGRDGKQRVLRTHTSPVQIRVMESQKPPIRVIAPGKVYRCDSDLTHTPMFHQVEGLLVDRDVHFGQLMGFIETFLRRFFERQLPVRFRPSFFPFTEPSTEVDMGCLFCEGSGCRICKGSGWIEILGAGLVHPNVLGNVGIDKEIYSGFAFGVGVERMAMLKYGIGDLRTFYENDVRFLAHHARGRGV